MSQQILVISPHHEVSQGICAKLGTLGYATTAVTSFFIPSTLEHRPALCIIDLQCYRDWSSEQWQAWLLDCHSIHAACLAFDSGKSPDFDSIARLEPLSDILTDPHNQELLAGKIHSLLTIRKLSRQLSATRHQLSHYQGELQDALQSAAHIQHSLIPTHQPSYANLRYSWKYMPCKKVGGDLFNIVQLDEQTVMTYLIDVSGHGMSSAMVTVSVHQSLSTHTGHLVKRPIKQPPFYEITPPGQVLQELETEYPFERFEEFFTISYVLINPHTGQLRYCNGGHPPPLLLRSDGSVERLHCGGTVIGVGNLVDFTEGETCLRQGDRLFMYTDGITEHIGKDGEVYGEGLFLNSLIAQQEKPLNATIQDSLIAMREFGGSTLPSDDVTLIGMEFSTETDN
jgi:sigma-B regulation protein RsbU (phosphoserine phosphatase)